MSSISSLLQGLPQISHSRMINSGIGLWLSWQGNLNTAVHNTLREYGALRMAEESDQSLWFASGNEVFRALARLQIWARLNPMPLIIQVIPVTFLVGYDLTRSVSVPAEFTKQRLEVPENIEVWIHPKLKEMVQRIAGLGVVDRSSPTGMANLNWQIFTADDGLDYETTLNWYFAIKPLGRMGEKDSIMGWRAFFQEVQPLLQRSGLKYITSQREEIVLFPLQNVRLLRTFCLDILKLIARVKADPDKKYWPCVMAAIPQRGRPFTDELPQKFNLDWNRLTPDFPHLQYRDAFMLAEWFKINEVRYGGAEESLESWCSLSLVAEDGEADQGTIDAYLPRTLMVGDNPECFYCGLKNHPASQCPSKKVDKVRFNLWNRLAHMDLDEITKTLHDLERVIDPAKSLEDTEGLLLADGKKPESLLIQSVFEVGVCSQTRLMRLVWRSRGKEWPEGLYQLVPEEGQFVWEALEAIREGEQEQAETLIKQARLKYARSFIPSCLQALWHMENEDLRQAHFFFQESERLSYTPLQQGLFLYLQARVMEIEEEYREAAQVYKKAHNTELKWLDPAYRGGVCMVKMGFTGQAIDIFFDLVDQDPNIFNRLLVDPEIERGRAQVLTAMWEKWDTAKQVFDKEKERVEELLGEIEQRFDEDHDFHEPALKELNGLKKLCDSNNYVAFRRLIDGLARFEERLGKEVDKEVKRIHAKADFLRDRLLEVQREAAWFPFPKLLRDFNRDFNYCVEKINWIGSQHLKGADTFRQSTRFIDEIEERITKLQSRLVTLRIVRDTTLFVLMLGRSFIWLELVGLGLALVGLPVTVYFTRGMHNNWIIDMIRDQQWEFQKGLILILSVVALVLALVKTAFRFDKRKRELFEQKEQELLEKAKERKARLRRRPSPPPAKKTE